MPLDAGSSYSMKNHTELRKCSSSELHFTSKTADYGTDLVKDFFTEHLALLPAPEIYVSL